MTYTIKLFSGKPEDATHGQYTAYAGTSLRSAQKTVDMMRSVLIMTGGTAQIMVSYNDGYSVPLYTVVDGQAKVEAQLSQEGK